MRGDGFNARERRVLSRLDTPEKIQRFLDNEVEYNKEPHGITCNSPRVVLRERVAHCVEGALLASAALEMHGIRPLLLDLEAVRDVDHVITVFRVDGCWGSIGKSNYAGLRYRTPVYRTIRELALSYFEHYYNRRGEKTLRKYSRPVSLSRFEHLDWRTTEEPVWEIPSYFCEIRHTPILPLKQRRQRFRMDRLLYEAGRYRTAV